MKRRNVLNKTIPILISIGLLACKTEPALDQERTLPYFGTHDVSLENQPDGTKLADTTYFTVPGFSFINQDSIEVSHQDYRNHIYVTDFFFTTCPSICPVMSAQMSRLQDMLKKKDLFGPVMLLSHTVDPAKDSPEMLQAYAERMGADTENWNFVTGDKDELYDQARYGYFMTALESDTAAGGFYHSDNFVLIDRGGRLRGYYDGTSTKEVNQLFEDILLLTQDENGFSQDSAK